MVCVEMDPWQQDQSSNISAANVTMSVCSVWEMNRSRLFCSPCRCDPVGLSAARENVTWESAGGVKAQEACVKELVLNNG